MCGLGDKPSYEDVLARANHPDAEVRYAVASSLAILEAEDPRTIDALIALSTDEDEDVRDWATFGLGWLLDANTPELREALFARVDDPTTTPESKASSVWFAGATSALDPT